MECMKEKILNQAIKMFKEKGFGKVSIDEICDECGVTKGSFYHHYKSKNDLLTNYYNAVIKKDTYAIMNEIITIDSAYEQLWKAIELYFIESVLEIGPSLFKNVIITDILEGKEVIHLYIDNNERLKEYLELLIKLIVKGQHNGEIRNSFGSEELLSSYFAGVVGIFVKWSSCGGIFDEKVELKKLFDIIFKP
jgi:AcrR family transcriptional regulator